MRIVMQAQKQGKKQRKKNAGFTLMELIVVMLISGIIAFMVVNIISTPMEGFSDQKRRAKLVDMAELSLHRIARDIRNALPNSIRISADAQTIEMLHTIAGGRYQKQAFSTSQPISQIKLYKALSNAAEIQVAPGVATNTQCARSGLPDCLVIYNLGNGISGSDAYYGGNISALKSIDLSAPDYPVSFVSHQFNLDSPQQRFFIINKAIAYTCNPLTGELLVNEAYNFIDNDNDPPAFSSGFLLASQTAQCHFTYQPGTLTRPALVTLEIGLSEEHETISLLHQVLIGNQP